MNTIRGLGNRVGGFSWGAETGHGREGTAGRNGNSNILGRSWDHLWSQTGDVDALSFILVRSGDDLAGS